MSDRGPFDAHLELARDEAVRGKSLVYAIVNTGAVTLICGLGYLLERRAEEEWTAANAGMAFRAIGFGVPPGQKRELTALISADAPVGEYRISTSVSDEGAGRSLRVTARFQVR